MPFPSPLHDRTSKLNQMQEWGDWAGHWAANGYQLSTETEYFAIRNAAGLLDVSPLFKYEITGPDALGLVDRLMTRDMRKCKVGQVMYTPWCDENGFVIDDGTISRLEQERFRITAADPQLRWFLDVGHDMNVRVSDVSQATAALALQGPNSRAILNRIFGEGSLNKLRYYRLMKTQFEGTSIEISRTGYTGDLGYELWIAAEKAPAIWDAIMKAGQNYALLPVGLAALDMARIEAGLLLLDVDYTSAHFALIPQQMSNPYELGLGWAVDLDSEDFIGRRALRGLKNNPDNRKLVGLEISWLDLEREFGRVDLPPQVSGRASRDPLPIYRSGAHIGQATSVLFSPKLKKYLALASVTNANIVGDEVQIETTVEYERRLVSAKIVKLPFFNPKHKRSLANG